MTTLNNTILEKAIRRQSVLERNRKIEKAALKVSRFILSFALPLAIAAVLALITFMVPGAESTNFIRNTGYYFCKVFFFCIPMQLWMITK